MAASATKTRLLDAGTELLMTHGYNDTGIQEILKKAGVPKGSFYHHFKNKEDFGLQAVQRYADVGYQFLDEKLSDESLPPVERVRGFFEDVFADWNSRACRHGCLLGNIGSELADVNDAFRQLVAASLEQWTVRIGMCLAEAQRRGELDPEIDTRALAERLIDGFEGAALRMKLIRSPSPLKGFLTVFFDRLLVR